MTGAGSGPEPLARPRLVLDGDASARPTGLERALTRAGFRIGEAGAAQTDPPPDAVLTTLHAADPERLAALLAHAAEEPPRVLLFAAEDREAAAAALALGAADALAAPVHLPELCARLSARIRDRQAPAGTPWEDRVRESLRDFVETARTALHPDEVALALVRRLGRALGLAACSYVVTRAGAEEGRVIADGADGQSPHARLELARYPEIAEAIRTRRALAMPDTHVGAPAGATLTVMPVIVDESVAGVLLMRGAESSPPLAAAQLGLAGSLAEMAARALDGVPRAPTPASLDRRLQEELERARRYSLGFSLVLLDLEPAAEAAPAEPDAAAPSRRQSLAERLRRELRLPDFVAGYGTGEIALVLPETDADGARRSVVRLRERLGAVTAGIVAYPHPAVTAPDDLFALVEAALRRGRAQTGERIGVAE